MYKNVQFYASDSLIILFDFHLIFSICLNVVISRPINLDSAAHFSSSDAFFVASSSDKISRRFSSVYLLPLFIGEVAGSDRLVRRRLGRL